MKCATGSASQCSLPCIIRAVVLCLLLSAIALALTSGDRDIATYYHMHPIPLYAVWQILTYAGNSALCLIGLVMVGAVLQWGLCRLDWAQKAWFLLLCVTVSSVICSLLKIVLGRARPIVWFQDQVYGFYGFSTQPDYWSFPSGHTSVVMSLAFGLALLFPRYIVLWLLPALCIAFSRIVLVQHYASDVIVAMVLALGEVLFLRYILHRFQRLSL